MTTTISVDMFSAESIAAAQGRIADWCVGKLKPAAAEFVEDLADITVRREVEERAHVDTGDLKMAIATTPVRSLGQNVAMLNIDPVHDKYPDNHYASYERDRGGDHDFTDVSADVMPFVRGRWERVRYKL